jgi:phosphomevalonate kinase
MPEETSKLVQKVEEKSNEVHFTEEEMTKLADLQSKYQSIQDRFGQTKLQKITAQQQMDALDSLEKNLEEEFSNIQKEEQKLVGELNETYGAGTLNPETGVFTPKPK